MSRADLFVVCKNPDCGAEVSPYITECPYCGTRLRKRAPKLDKGKPRERRHPSMPASLGRLHAGEIPGIRGESHPYVTSAIVLATLVVWLLTRTTLVSASSLVVAHAFGNQWWRPLSAPFTYFYSTNGSQLGTGTYQFATLSAIALYGYLLERRHGGFVVLALFLVGACGGVYAAGALDTQVIADGANGGALALLCAWAVPDLLARSQGRDYDGDLLGTAAIALMLLLMPVARPEANAVAGGVGVVIGYGAGMVLARLAAR